MASHIRRRSESASTNQDYVLWLYSEGLGRIGTTLVRIRVQRAQSSGLHRSRPPNPSNGIRDKDSQTGERLKCLPPVRCSSS